MAEVIDLKENNKNGKKEKEKETSQRTPGPSNQLMQGTSVEVAR